MDYSSPRAQNAFNFSSHSKYTAENGIPIEYQSVTMLPVEDEVLGKNDTLLDEVEDSASDEPDCPNVAKAEEEIYERIVEKLYGAYESLCPVIDEIISNATEYTATSPDTQILEYSDDTMCSVTHEQYIGAIKASQLIQDIHTDVLQSTKFNLELSKEDTFHLPAPDFIVNSMQHSIYPKVEEAFFEASSSRIYIEKHVVEQLIELYNLLHGALQQFSQTTVDKESSFNKTDKVFSEKCNNVFEALHASKNQDEPLNNTDGTENSKLLTKLQEEYQGLSDAVDMLKSIIKETSGSISDIKKLRKTMQDARKSKSDNSVVELETSQKITDVSGARRCILECLFELAGVRKYLKNLENRKESKVVSQICVAEDLKKACCDKQNIPHLHARLNGIPIVVKLN